MFRMKQLGILWVGHYNLFVSVSLHASMSLSSWSQNMLCQDYLGWPWQGFQGGVDRTTVLKWSLAATFLSDSMVKKCHAFPFRMGRMGVSLTALPDGCQNHNRRPCFWSNWPSTYMKNWKTIKPNYDCPETVERCWQVVCLTKTSTLTFLFGFPAHERPVKPLDTFVWHIFVGHPVIKEAVPLLNTTLARFPKRERTNRWTEHRCLGEHGSNVLIS